MKSKKIFLSALFFMITVACTNGKENISNNTIDENKISTPDIVGEEIMSTTVTKEWIKDRFNFTDEDLEGINVEEVADALWWDQDSVIQEFGNDSDTKRLLAVLKSSQKQLSLVQNPNEHTATYESLTGNASSDEISDFSNLKTIEIIGEIKDNEYWNCVSGLMDITSKKIYYTVNDDVAFLVGSDIQGAEEAIESYELTDEDINTVILSLNKDLFVPKNSSDIWTVVVECNDGSVFRYSMNIDDNTAAKQELLYKFFSKMNDKTANGFLEEQQ